MQPFQKTSPLDYIFSFDINCWAFIELLRSTKIMKLVVTMRKTWICSKYDWKKQAQQYLKVGVETIAVNLIGNEIFWFDFLCIIIGSPPALRWLLLSFDDI